MNITRELAEKLFETMRAVDPYEVIDNDYTIENAMEDLINDPYNVISCMCDYILESV